MTDITVKAIETELSEADLDIVAGGCSNDFEHAFLKAVYAFPNFIINRLGGGAIKPLTCGCGRKW